MQPIQKLLKGLIKLADTKRFLFAPEDLRGLIPDVSDNAFKILLSRAVKEKHLARVCRGLYVYEPSMSNDGLLLFHAANRLRADQFNYISLETALSEAGVISQTPINRITLMTSGRSNVIDCGHFGSIEFVHTNNQPEKIAEKLHYDDRCGMWRANVDLALRDMRATHRNMDLINFKEAMHEFI